MPRGNGPPERTASLIPFTDSRRSARARCQPVGDDQEHLRVVAQPYVAPLDLDVFTVGSRREYGSLRGYDAVGPAEHGGDGDGRLACSNGGPGQGAS